MKNKVYMSLLLAFAFSVPLKAMEPDNLPSITTVARILRNNLNNLKDINRTNKSLTIINGNEKWEISQLRVYFNKNVSEISKEITNYLDYFNVIYDDYHPYLEGEPRKYAKDEHPLVCAQIFPKGGPNSLVFHIKRINDNSKFPKTGNNASRTVSPFKGTFPIDMKRLILQRVISWQCLDKISPANIALVCEEWGTIVNEVMEKHKPCWMTWYYGIVGPEQERIYQQFLNGTLVYRPNPASDEGMKTLKISDLSDPFEGTFDLSECGDTGEYLSISTGYRKRLLPLEDRSKVEIWFTPRFVINKNLNSSASNFKYIMDKWDEEVAPVGIFFNWGWKITNYGEYDYLTHKSFHFPSSSNLSDSWAESQSNGSGSYGLASNLPGDPKLDRLKRRMSHFILYMYN